MQHARGRVRAVTGRTRRLIEHGWQALATSPGACKGPHDLARDGAHWVSASVPCTAASLLRAAGLWSQDERRNFDGEDWWWRVRFDEPITGILGFDGIATLWDAWLDGEWVAAGRSMHEARAIDVTIPARELVIRCRAIDAELAIKRPKPRWRVPALDRQQLRWIRTTLVGRIPGEPPPCAPVGPWRPIWLQPRDAPDVGVVSLDARVESGAGFVSVGAQLPRGTGRAVLVLARGGERIVHELEPHTGAWTGCAVVPEPALWWPHTHGEPALYEAWLELNGDRGGDGDGGELRNERSVRNSRVELGAIGFRTVEVDRSGGFALRVNGTTVAHHAARWMPLDLVSLAAPASAYDDAIARLCAAGTNLVRVAGTTIYEIDALYDALDARGVLLWQDLMFASMDYPEDDAAFRSTVDAEVDAQLARLQARPALAIVCGHDATGEHPEQPLFADAFAARARALAPGAVYVPSSAGLPQV